MWHPLTLDTSRNDCVPFSTGAKSERDYMPTRNLSRRLDRLEAELAPRSDEPVLTILVTSPGQPDEIIEVRGTAPTGRRRRRWPPPRNGWTRCIKATETGMLRVFFLGHEDERTTVFMGRLRWA
jgi:hypothetical protein